MPGVLEEKDAIRELLARYCFHFDNGEFDAWLDLFTAEGVFDVEGVGRFCGRAGLQQLLERIPLVGGVPLIRHCVMNSIIHVDGACATASCYVVVLRRGAPPAIDFVGRYEDQLVKEGAEWRFTERRVFLDRAALR